VVVLHQELVNFFCRDIFPEVLDGLGCVLYIVFSKSLVHFSRAGFPDVLSGLWVDTAYAIAWPLNVYSSIQHNLHSF
jgi:hypothetical protein